MGEHTPGPLKIRKESQPSGVPRLYISDSDGFSDIAEVYTNAAEDLGWADAQLFAASPELLESAIRVLDEVFLNAGASDSEARTTEALSLLAEAVAKAEGR